MNIYELELEEKKRSLLTKKTFHQLNWV